MSEKALPSDPNGLHFAAGAFIGGMTGLALNYGGLGQHDAAMVGLAATCAAGLLKALRDRRRHPPLTAFKYGALIASGGLITPLMLALQ